jgi:predicted metalloprotease with PDZ domain
LYQYYTSPSNNEPNDRIRDDYLTHDEVGKLPYQRGSLFALYWDYEIRKKTNDLHSLDDVMLALWNKKRPERVQISVNDIIDQASIYLGEQARLDIEKYIIRGETIAPTQQLFDGQYSLNWIENPTEVSRPIPQYRLHP